MTTITLQELKKRLLSHIYPSVESQDLSVAIYLLACRNYSAGGFDVDASFTIRGLSTHSMGEVAKALGLMCDPPRTGPIDLPHYTLTIEVGTCTIYLQSILIHDRK